MLERVEIRNCTRQSSGLTRIVGGADISLNNIAAYCHTVGIGIYQSDDITIIGNEVYNNYQNYDGVAYNKVYPSRVYTPNVESVAQGDRWTLAAQYRFYFQSIRTYL